MASSIPAALTNLIQILTAALPATTQVNVGPELPRYVAPQTLEILGVTGDQAWAEMSGPNYKREETFAIQCKLTSWAGDQDWESRFQEALVLFDVVSVAVGTNMTLNGAVRLCEVGSLDLVPMLTKEGSAAGFLFSVHASQRIQSLS